VLLQAGRADGTGVARILNTVLVAGDTKVRKAKRGEIVPRLNKERGHS
jgi:hypothetical protein